MSTSNTPSPRAHYRISVPHPERHLVEVELELSGAAALGDSIDLQMAAWSPGSYLIRDYARYVRGVTATSAAGDALQVDKTDKATWRVLRAGADVISVSYQVYGHDLTVRTNHVDASHAFLHGPATFLYAPALASEACDVTVYVPQGWSAHTGLSGEPARYTAKDLDELLDCPIHLGAVAERAFEAAGKPVSLAVWGTPAGTAATLDDLVGDLTKLIKAHAARFGGVPYRDYTFILMLSPDAYGGLEHENSSANLATPFSFSTRRAYEDLLELLSHEFFHVWNGKRIRPAVLGPFDYAREAYTRSLWVQEGITSYIDRYTVRRADCQSPRSYLEKLAEEWGRLQGTPGRAVQSVEASSFDAWIKLYKPDESNVNTTVSYYLKGGLVALAIDLEIRAQTDGRKSMADVLSLLWQRFGDAPRGYRDDEVQALFEEATGATLGPLFDRCVRGTEDPDLPAALAPLGLELRSAFEPAPAEGRTPVWLGAMVAGALDVRAVLDGGPGAEAGLSPGDRIVAIERWQVSSEAELRKRLGDAAPGRVSELALLRRGRLELLPVTLAAAPPNRWEIAAAEAPSDAERARFEAWLGAPHPGGGAPAGATNTAWL